MADPRIVEAHFTKFVQDATKSMEQSPDEAVNAPFESKKGKEATLSMLGQTMPSAQQLLDVSSVTRTFGTTAWSLALGKDCGALGQPRIARRGLGASSRKAPPWPQAPRWDFCNPPGDFGAFVKFKGPDGAPRGEDACAARCQRGGASQGAVPW